jgi:hypothetical protein
VSQLNRWNRTLFRDEVGYLSQFFDVAILPDPQVLGTDPTTGFHGCRFRHHQPCPTNSAGTKVDKVPICGEPVGTRILTHGRNRDPVAQCHSTQSKWLKEMHRLFLSENLFVLTCRRYE